MHLIYERNLILFHNPLFQTVDAHTNKHAYQLIKSLKFKILGAFIEVKNFLVILLLVSLVF